MDENVYTVKLRDVVVSADLRSIFIVTNYVPSNLKNLLQSKKNDLTELHTQAILFKLLCALNFLHKANVMHRDIKPGNILVDEFLNLQICDFGLARSFEYAEKDKKTYTREAMTNKLLSFREEP